MKNTNYKKLLTPFVLILMLIVCSSWVTATPLSFTSSGWEQNGKFNTRASFQNPTYFANFSEEVILDSVGQGSSYQPIIADLDNDDKNELVTFSSQVLYIYDVNVNSLTLLDNLDMNGTTQENTPIAVNIDSDDYIELILGVNNSIHVAEFNGTNLNFQWSNTTNTDIETGFACENISGVVECYFGDSNGDLIQYFPANNSINVLYDISNANLFECDYSKFFAPPIADMDNDGNYELAMCQELGTYQGWLMIDLETGAIDINDTQVANIVTMTGITAYNFDNAGLDEICVIGNGNPNPRYTYLYCFTPSGSQLMGKTVDTASTSSSASSQIVAADTDGDGYREICGFGSDTNAGDYSGTIACYSPLDYSTTRSISFTAYEAAYAKPFTTADVNDDGFNDLLMLNTIYLGTDDNTSHAGVISLSGTPIGMLPTDVNDDDVLDMVTFKSSYLATSFSNNGSAWDLTLSNRDFGRNFNTPVCLDTTVTFTATECGVEPCHYNNGIDTRQERLISDCGRTYYENGSLALSTPSVQCTMNTTGSYNVNIYLQDETLLNDFSLSQSVNLYVVNGTSGVDCNLPVTSDTLTGSNATAVAIADEDKLTSEDEIKFVVDTMTGQSAFVEIIMVLMFTAMACFGLAKGGIKNPIAYAVVIVALWIGFTLIGWLDWIYIVLFGFISMLLTVGMFIIGRSDG